MAVVTYPGIEGRTAVVTGGAKGIGEACVRMLVNLGAKAAVLDVDAESGNALASSVGDHCRAYRIDVSNSDDVRTVFHQVGKDLGPPTLLVNNAGIVRYGTATETTDAQWDRVLNVNLKSYFLCAREAIPYMLAEGSGAIVNVASIQSFMSQQRVVSYSASKAGILGLTRAIAVDHAPAIRCNAVCPGTVDTPMLANAITESPDPDAVLQECHAMHLLKRIGQPAEIAHLVAYLLSDLAAFITGQAIRIDGGLGLEIGGSKRN